MKNRTNFILDTVIFLGFLAAAAPSLTGLAIHEWLSLALAATLLVHLFMHADGVWSGFKRFFSKLWHSSRLNLVVNLALLVAFVGVMLSGILNSREVLGVLGIRLAENGPWRQIHRLTADASIWLTALHFALHWRWIVNAMKRYMFTPLSRVFAHQPLPINQPVAQLEAVKVEEGQGLPVKIRRDTPGYK